MKNGQNYTNENTAEQEKTIDETKNQVTDACDLVKPEATDSQKKENALKTGLQTFEFSKGWESKFSLLEELKKQKENKEDAKQ